MIPMMTLQAQRIDDDMYYTPKKKTAVKAKENSQQTSATERVVDGEESDAPREVVTEQTDLTPKTVVVRDRKKNVVQDEDSYNRRYSSRQYDFSTENDTLYVDEREDSDLRGEWQRDFDGSDSDYEYATRIIRFRNPRYAVSISSPLYWDIVSGAFLGYEWNVYYDDMYAYVFPTTMNRLYWDWRFDWHTPYWGWSSWYSPWYSSWHSPWYGGWSIGWYGGWNVGWSIGWHGHFGGWGWHHPHYWGGWNHNWNVATNRPSLASRNSVTSRGGVATRGESGNGRGVVSRSSGTRSSVSTRSSQSTVGQRATGTERSQTVGTRSNSQIRRVVSSRTADGSRNEAGLNGSTTGGRSSYNRPSSTRSTAAAGTGRSTYTRPSRTVSGESNRTGGSTTFSRGSSTTRERSYSVGNSSSTRSYESGSSSRSFSSGSSSRSFSSGSSSFGGGGSSRSFGRGGSSQRSSSGGRR